MAEAPYIEAVLQGKLGESGLDLRMVVREHVTNQ
jgi:hypothetical protein